jgi:hypothetical protein
MNKNKGMIVVLQIKPPVGVDEMVAITGALTRLHGVDLFMRYDGELLQIYKDEREPNGQTT